MSFDKIICLFISFPISSNKAKTTPMIPPKLLSISAIFYTSLVCSTISSDKKK